MSKVKKFVEQPIFSQILNCVAKQLISEVCILFNANRYYKKIPLRVHLVSLLLEFLHIVMAWEKSVKEYLAARENYFT